MSLLIGNWKLVVLGLLLAVIGIQTWRLDRAQTREVAIRAEFDKFKGGVAALGAAAEQRKREQEDRDRKAKESADAENAATISRLDADISRLRRERDNSRVRFLSAATTCPANPDDSERYRTEFERAYRVLVEGLRGVGNQCSKATVDLNTAKTWAQGR